MAKIIMFGNQKGGVGKLDNDATIESQEITIEKDLMQKVRIQAAITEGSLPMSS